MQRINIEKQLRKIIFAEGREGYADRVGQGGDRPHQEHHQGGPDEQAGRPPPPEQKNQRIEQEEIQANNRNLTEWFIYNRFPRIYRDMKLLIHGK